MPAARLWGDGTFSSSDGQRFPVQVKALNAGALPRYFGFGRGISVLTSVTDHYATYGTRVIASKVREGLFALDEIFALRDRDSELSIAEHTTDTAGFTDLLFGAYDLVGLGFCPASATWPTNACGASTIRWHRPWYCIAAFNAELLGRAVEHLRAAGSTSSTGTSPTSGRQ